MSASLLAPMALSPFVVNPVCAADIKTQVDVYEQQKLVKSIVFVIGQDQYFVNNSIQGVKMDAKPFIQDDRTFVPVRYLGYALGLAEKDIIWENNIQKVTMRGPINSIEMAVGSKAIVVMATDKLINNTLEIADRDLQIIDVAPLLKAEESRTYLPARYVAESLGYQIEWDAVNGIVLCYPKGDPKPDISKVVEYVQQVKSGEVQPDQPQVSQPVTDSNKNNGYTVPSKTDLNIETTFALGNPNKVDIDLCIKLEKPLDQQYQDANNIIASKFGEEIAKEIVDYAKQKQKRFDNLPSKEWHVNNQKLFIRSNPGDYWINITLIPAKIIPTLINLDFTGVLEFFVGIDYTYKFNCEKIFFPYL